MAKRERPQIEVPKQERQKHGVIISVLLLILAWPLAIAYWIYRLVAWALGTAFDWLTAGPLRRLRR